MSRIFKYFEFLLENSNTSILNDYGFDIQDDKVKVYHYSSKHITDDFLKINTISGLHSREEFRSWSRPRLFFYGKENGYLYDKGVPTSYLYICHIPYNQIYPINENPNNFKKLEGIPYVESIYQQSIREGYTAFCYYLNNNPRVPIVVSFEDVKITDSYKSNNSGNYIPLNRELIDYPIGEINIDGEEWYIIQKSELSKDISNTYLSKEKDSKGGYRKPFPYYLMKNSKIYDNYKNDYQLPG